MTPGSAMAPFWMVYGMGQGAPMRRHPSFSSASDEAKRLARSHPDVVFVVLESKKAVVKRDVDEIPIADPEVAHLAHAASILDEHIPF